MIQTLAMVIVLVVVGVVLQTNTSMIHTRTPLMLPGDSSVPISYFRLLLGLAAGAVLVWLAGLLDLAIVHARLRRRDADVLTVEQDLARFKAAAFDRHQPAWDDVRGRLEVVVQELRGMVARIENALSGVPDRMAPGEAAAISAERLAPAEPVTVGSRPFPGPESPGGHEEVAVQPRKRWPL